MEGSRMYSGNNFLEMTRDLVMSRLQDVEDACLRCRNAFHVFVEKRMAGNKAGAVNADTVVVYQNQERPVGDLLHQNVAIDFEKGYRDAEAGDWSTNFYPKMTERS